MLLTTSIRCPSAGPGSLRASTSVRSAGLKWHWHPVSPPDRRLDSGRQRRVRWRDALRRNRGHLPSGRRRPVGRMGRVVASRKPFADQERSCGMTTIAGQQDVGQRYRFEHLALPTVLRDMYRALGL